MFQRGSDLLLGPKGRKSNRFLLISFLYKMTVAPVILLPSVLTSVSYVICIFHDAHVILKSCMKKGLTRPCRIMQWAWCVLAVCRRCLWGGEDSDMRRRKETVRRDGV